MYNLCFRRWGGGGGVGVEKEGLCRDKDKECVCFRGGGGSMEREGLCKVCM